MYPHMEYLAMPDNIVDRDSAGPLIPEQVVNDILQDMPHSSAALNLMRQVSMSSRTRRQPVMGSFPHAYWVGGDTGLKQTTDMMWENKYLVAEELAVIVPIPDAVISDADFDLWGEIQPRLAEAFGVKIDEAVLFGADRPSSWDDESIVQGAISAGNTVAMGSGGDLVSDINDAMAEVEDDGFDVNGFAARRRIRSKLRDLRDDNRNPIFSPSLHAEGTATIYGEPLQYVSNGAWDDEAAELISGDWDRAIIGIRQDITYETFTEGVISDDDGRVILNLMQQDSRAMRAVMRLGFAVANPLTRLNPDDDSRYPFSVVTPGNGNGGGDPDTVTNTVQEEV